MIKDIWKGRKKWRERYVGQGGLCALCGYPVPPSKMTRDHIVPKGIGGSADWDNIRLVDEQCHKKRHQKV